MRTRPASNYGLGRPWYDQALANKPASWQFEIAAAGTQGSLNGRQAKAERMRFRRAEDFQRWWAWKGTQLEQGLRPTPIETRPVALAADEATT